MFQAVINFQLKLYLVLLCNGSILVQCSSRQCACIFFVNRVLNRRALIEPKINIDVEDTDSLGNMRKLFKPTDSRRIHKTSCLGLDPRMDSVDPSKPAIRKHGKIDNVIYLTDRKVLFTFYQH